MTPADFAAVRITVLGDFERIGLDRGQLLQSLNAAIDCQYVEVVQPIESICIWVDEEGLMHRAQPNLLATLIAAELGFFGQVLHGTVVVTWGGNREGNTQPLSDVNLRLLQAVVHRIAGVGQEG